MNRTKLLFCGALASTLLLAGVKIRDHFVNQQQSDYESYEMRLLYQCRGFSGEDLKDTEYLGTLSNIPSFNGVGSYEDWVHNLVKSNFPSQADGGLTNSSPTSHLAATSPAPKPSR